MAAGVVALACVLALPAAAQDDTTLEGEARGLFTAGASAYEGGRYEEALRYFQRAYELSGRPGLLYNIGSAAERTRDDELALRSYREYLERVPDAPNRTRVVTRIEALQRQLAQASAPTPTPTPTPTTTPTPAPTPTPATEPSAQPRATSTTPEPAAAPPSSGGADVTGPAVVLGIAGAALVTFAIVGGLTLAENDSVSASCGASLAMPMCTDSELSGLATLAAITDVAWITAALAGTVGLVWLAVSLSSGGGGERAMRVAPWASASAGGVVLSGDMEVF